VSQCFLFILLNQAYVDVKYMCLYTHICLRTDGI